MVRTVSQWANGCLEREGLARLTISILVITTAGCLAYTWGYAEGVHNSKAVIAPSHAATPLVFPAADVHSTERSTDTVNEPHKHGAKRVHRRRARKQPGEEGPATAALISAEGAAVTTATHDQPSQQQELGQQPREHISGEQAGTLVHEQALNN